MSCEAVRNALSLFQACAETPSGSRLMTHCLYPSFEPVDVYVNGYGDGFRVHDLGGARREGWLYGVGDPLMTRFLNQEASRHQLTVENGSLVAVAQTPEWLFAAVTAVANASANAARLALESVGAGVEEALAVRVGKTLEANFPISMLRSDYRFRGKSGKDHHFDFALRGGGSNTILINVVSSHHFSISSKYVTFADTKIQNYEDIGRFAVYDRPLEENDGALLGQVAGLVPLKSPVAGAHRFMERHDWPIAVRSHH